MRVEEWFALALRVVGVVVLVYGVGYLLDSLLFHLGYFHYSESSAGYYVIAGAAFVFGGLGLIRGAPYLVRFAYPIEDDESDNEEDAERRDA
jgi:hypothetical protein